MSKSWLRSFIYLEKTVKKVVKCEYDCIFALLAHVKYNPFQTFDVKIVSRYSDV